MPPAPVPYAAVTPGRPLRFPRDHGAHPDFRTEWWYLTGWLRRGGGTPPCGVQITFFRSRTGHTPSNPSRFAPRQLVLAHVALALPERRALLHDQRAAREGFGLVYAGAADADVALDDWRLRRDADDRYHATIAADGFSLRLAFAPPAAPFVQGDDGYSRKGPRPEQASYYYSRPQLAVTGELRIGDGAAASVEGRAWLDHEWSSEVLAAQASGWDWCGLNLDDGSALMAFVVRDKAGQRWWSHAQWISAADARGDPRSAHASPSSRTDDVRFEPRRSWRSTRTGVTYPVEVDVVVDDRRLRLTPLFDDQELDSRSTTGAIYWEGAVEVGENGRTIGRGYLELTGYGTRLRM
ncbi:MAG: carotenoid 1,2-hydratase [Burkholderiaceae bacterium]